MVERKEHRPVSLRNEVYEQFRELQSKIRYEKLRGANLSLSDTLVFLMDAYKELQEKDETELAVIRKDVNSIKEMLLPSSELIDVPEEPEDSIDVPEELGEILSRFKGNPG